MSKNRNINLFEIVIKLLKIIISKTCFFGMLLNALESMWFKFPVKWPKNEKVTIFSSKSITKTYAPPGT